MISAPTDKERTVVTELQTKFRLAGLAVAVASLVGRDCADHGPGQVQRRRRSPAVA